MDESFLDVETRTGTGFEEGHAELFGKGCSLLGIYHLLVCKICFIANKYTFDVLTPVCMRFHLSDPITHVVKAVLRCTVIHNNDPLCILKVSLSNGPISLLARCVPNLQLYIFAVNLDGFYLKVDADRGDVRGVEVFICELEEETGLADL